MGGNNDFLSPNLAYFNDKTLDFRLRDSSLTNSWVNRNALHVDTTGEVSRNKSRFQRILDSIKGVRDESETGNEYRSQIFLKNYNPFNKISAGYTDVVDINHKEDYLESIGTFLGDRISKNGELTDDSKEMLKYLLEKGYISKEFILNSIKKYIKFRGKEILKMAIEGVGVIDQLRGTGQWVKLEGVRLPYTTMDMLDFDKKIFAYCVQEGFFTDIELSKVNLRFYDYYRNKEDFMEKCGGDLAEKYYQRLVA